MGITAGAFGEQDTVTVARVGQTGGTPVALCTAKPNRKILTFKNEGSVKAWIGKASTITTAAGSFSIAVGAVQNFTGEDAQGAWWLITDSGTCDIAVIEGVA